MSKTDKTRPWWVRATEVPMHTCAPVHRHETGVCDLPEDPAANHGEGFGFDPNHCYWTETYGFWYGRDHGCGCPMCSGQVWRRLERRADRHAAARLCRDALRTAANGMSEDVEDFDDYVPHVPMW